MCIDAVATEPVGRGFLFECLPLKPRDLLLDRFLKGFQRQQLFRGYMKNAILIHRSHAPDKQVKCAAEMTLRVKTVSQLAV